MVKFIIEKDNLCDSCTKKENCPSDIDHPKNGDLVEICSYYNETKWHKQLRELKPPEGDWQHPTDMHY